MIFLAAALLTSFFGFYILFLFLDVLTQPMRCCRPLPGRVVWDRCSTSCQWCDNIERWEREEPHTHGPYRTSDPPYQQVEDQ